MTQTVTTSDIGWGRYLAFEGPFFRGRLKYQLPANPTQDDEILYVIAATEGGAYDAYNGYDRCICTGGLIQWCDVAPLFLFTKLLGHIADTDISILTPLLQHAEGRGYEFTSTSKGWRFRHKGTSTIVDTADAQRKLCLGGSSGFNGGWSDTQRNLAKSWAAACANIWQSEKALQLQREYTANRLYWFATKSAKLVLDKADTDGGVYGKIFKAAYLSFAANNPDKASQALQRVSSTGITWDSLWLFKVLKALVFDAGFAIYPHRYNTIRPILETLYGVDLPDMADQLKKWGSINNFKSAITTETLQKSLISLGYDLGPAGSDGVFGPKTQKALTAFENERGIPIPFQDGLPDKYTVPALQDALKDAGLPALWD